MSKVVRIASLLVIALATVALAACGGDDDEAGGDDVTVTRGVRRVGANGNGDTHR